MNKYSEAMENIKVTDEMRSRILRNVALSLESGKDEAESETESEAEIEKEAEIKTEKEAEKETVRKTGETITANESADITEFRSIKKRRSGAWITPVALTAAAALILVIVRPWSGSSLMSANKGSSSFDAAMSEDASADYHYDSETAVAETTEDDSWDEDYPVYEDAMLEAEAEAAEEETKDNSEGIEGMVFDATEFPSVREMSDAIGFEVNDISVVPFEATEVIYRVISGKLAEIVYIGDGDKLTIRKSAGDEDNSGDYNEYTLDEPIEIEGNKIDILGFEEGYYLVTWYDGEYFHSIRSDSPQTADKMKEIISDLIKGE